MCLFLRMVLSQTVYFYLLLHHGKNRGGTRLVAQLHVINHVEIPRKGTTTKG
jgi:hypothetical protein